MDNKKIVSREPRFVHYLPPPKYKKDDYHLVKELIHFEDGSSKPNIRFIKNYEREFFITQPGFRNHKQPKEWELKSRLQKFKSRQYELADKIAQSLDTFVPYSGIRELFENPYIYGAEISSTSLLKYQLSQEYNGDFHPFTVAVFDTETDMIEGHKEVIMATISFKDRVYTAIDKSYLNGEKEVIPRLKELLNSELKEFVEKRNITWQVDIVSHRMDILINCFKRANEWMPDWVEIWNIDFDIPMMLKMCDKYKYDPREIFCNQKIPRDYRRFWYRKGQVQKKTASGLITPISPAEQWHTVDCSSNFQFIDGMQAYCQIRTGSAKLPSYSMDAIMGREIGLRKLRFNKGSHIREGSVDWHIWMQKHAKLEYVIYNVFDCIGLELLDEHINDLSIAQPRHAKYSDLSIFDSQPKRKATELHFYLQSLKEPRVIGVSSKALKNELDDETWGLSNWITALDNQLISDDGMNIIKENPNLKSRAYIAVADLDIKSSYPSNGACLNISKETTKNEIISIETLSDNNRNEIMNLMNARTDSIQFCINVFNLPSMEDWLSFYDKKTNL